MTDETSMPNLWCTPYSFHQRIFFLIWKVSYTVQTHFDILVIFLCYFGNTSQGAVARSSICNFWSTKDWRRTYLGINLSCTLKDDWAWMKPVFGSSSMWFLSSLHTSNFKRRAVVALKIRHKNLIYYYACGHTIAFIFNFRFNYLFQDFSSTNISK